MRARTLVAAALLAVVGCEPAWTKTVANVETQSAPYPLASQEGLREPLWPRRFEYRDVAIASYEPQVDAWNNDMLAARVAVELLPLGESKPTYGVAYVEARTVTDREHGLVSFEDVRVVRVRIPTAKEREPEVFDALRGADLLEAKTTTVDRLKAEIAYSATQRPLPSQDVKNTPPRVLVSNRPTVLVLIDGAPKRRRADGGVERIINTRALVVSDRKGSTYVWAGDRWFRSSSIAGSYAEAKEVPPEVDAVKKRLEASPTVDLFAGAAERVREGASVIVATKPTEVIETRGAPVYERIRGTLLSWVSNTESDVLRDETTKKIYVLLSGRWFRAPSLEGPWTFVAAEDLPDTFRSIPKDHREARVLASIPKTTEAEEAIIAASVPQTATVNRGQVRLAVAYDGPPDFEPVEGTTEPLEYAVNSPTPVLLTADGMYYAVENGVWFVSASPDGPWVVATSVPEVVYSIPPSSPVHYVTYVRIYGYSPDYAYLGYTPGYMGAIYTDGVVVWGTGYAYTPWIGSVWFGRPSTWGFGIGFGFRPPVVVAGRPHPWWGPTRFWRPGWGYREPLGLARANAYQHWSPSIVRAPPAHMRIAPRIGAPPAPRVAPGAPRVSSPPAPRVQAPGAPRVSSPPAPRVQAPGAPRVVAPPAPRVGVPAAPRVGAPPAPHVGAPAAPRVFAAPPATLPRAAPPVVAPPAPRVGAPAPRVGAPPAPRVGAPPAPRVGAPGARSRGGRR